MTLTRTAYSLSVILTSVCGGASERTALSTVRSVCSSVCVSTVQLVRDRCLSREAVACARLVCFGSQFVSCINWLQRIRGSAARPLARSLARGPGHRLRTSRAGHEARSAEVGPPPTNHSGSNLSDLSSGLEVQALSRGEMESNERVAAIVTSTVLVPAPGSRRSSRTQPLAVSRQPNARSSNPVNNLLTMSTIS